MGRTVKNTQQATCPTEDSEGEKGEGGGEGGLCRGDSPREVGRGFGGQWQTAKMEMLTIMAHQQVQAHFAVPLTPDTAAEDTCHVQPAVHVAIGGAKMHSSEDEWTSS